jgi:predicted GNAT superfamily acetyltransferase
MSSLALWSVIDVVALIAGLAVYLYIVGRQLTKVAGTLEEAADLVWEIKKDAEVIHGGLTQINSTGGIVAGALPLLYTMAEGIVTGATYVAEPAGKEREVAKPAMGVRRSRQMHGVGVDID